MWIRNTSQYPTPVVRELIRYAAEWTDVRAVQVNVKNSRGVFRGSAYPGIPRIARAHRHARYLVTIGLGSAEKFPTDNMHWDWRPLKPGEATPEVPPHYLRLRNGIMHVWAKRAPYGGKESPFITYENWREALVGVAAHEFWHLHQYQHKQPLRECDCERAGLRVLNQWRTTQACIPSVAQEA